MAFLQFISGSRDQDLAELNDSASLTVGSDPQAHVRLEDPGIEPRHCQVYPAEGAFWLQNFAPATVIDMARVAPQETRQLKDKAVFILGQTYVKFWRDKPPAGGGGGGGADPAALSEAQQRLSEAQAELERLKASGAESGQLQQQLDEQRRATESAQGELRALRDELQAAKKEGDSLRSAKEEAEGKISQAEAEMTKAKAEADAAVAEAKEEAERQVTEAKEQAEQAADEAKSEAAAELEHEKLKLAEAQAESEQALAATQTALEVLRDRAEALGRDPLAGLDGPSQTLEILEALSLPEELRQRVELAVRADIDREVIRRSAGPVVPVRGLRVPGSDVDLEGAILAVRRSGEQARVARELQLHELDDEALAELLAQARS